MQGAPSRSNSGDVTTGRAVTTHPAQALAREREREGERGEKEYNGRCRTAAEQKIVKEEQQRVAVANEVSGLTTGQIEEVDQDLCASKGQHT